MQDSVIEDREVYWRRQFPRAVPLVPLPLDRPRPPVPSYRRDTIEINLGADLVRALRTLIRDRHTSSLPVFLAALQVTLFRYSSQESIVVGAVELTPGDLENVSDARAGLIPFQMEWSAGQARSGRDLVQQIGARLAEARAHGPCPIDELMSSAAIQDPAYGPRLFNVAICVAEGADASEWPTSDPALDDLLTPCDVVIVAALSDTGITLRGIYDADLLDAETTKRLLGHVGMILEGLVHDPDANVLGLPMLTAAEARDLIGDAGASSSPSRFGTATLQELFEAQVDRTPEAVALTCDGRSLTYAQLNARANQVAHALRDAGVGPDVLVGLCLDRSLELVIGLLGILKAGGAYLPIDLAYPRERLAFMLDDAQAPILLTQSVLSAEVPSHRARVIVLDDPDASAFQAQPSTNPSSGATQDNLAYVIYTSGTTGQPKGSLITHGNVRRLFSATERWFGFGPSDVWTLFHSVAFDFSVWEIWGALLYGGRVVVVPFAISRSPEAFYTLLANEDVTVLNQTPSAFRQLMQGEATAGEKTLALRYVIFGGEALGMPTLRPWFDRHGDELPRLVNMYGITETTVHVTYRPLSIEDLECGSVIGVPIPDLQVYVLDRQRQLVPIGVPGELYVGGAGLGRGYLSRPELTAARFVPDHIREGAGGRLYRTGDLARRLKSGELEFLGRADDQVKIRGFRIELGEIESLLAQHPSVQGACVIARQDGDGDRRLVAYVVSRGRAPVVSGLRAHLGRLVPDYMVPAAFVFLDKFPLTASGKIDRKALPTPETQRPELGSAYAPPRTAAEAALATIWSKVLRLRDVGIHDNFFELGGDSILALQVVAAARDHRLNMTPALLFAHQTVAELAAAVGIAGEDGPAPAGESREGDVPLTPIQGWFFEQNLAESQHYNQAFLFETRESIDREALESAVAAVSGQHDALRLRFVRDGSTWRQFYSTAREAPPVEWIDLSTADDRDVAVRLERGVAGIHGRLDLERGPLWRVVFFNLGPNRPGRLLIVVHHLAVDGVSWRPLLEDLETACRQSGNRLPIELPARTSSFKTWAERLRALANQAPLATERTYWDSVTRSGRTIDAASLLPRRTADADDLEGSAITLKRELSAEETLALLQRVPSAYNTQINDLLLAALLVGWSRWSGARALFTNLEGHGREALFDDVDVSRTVGWFTSLFPVFLEMPDDPSDAGLVLTSVKEQLRRIPQRGVGYGILRYLAQPGFVSNVEPRVIFNYFGQMDQLVAGSSLFRFACEPAGAWHSPKQRRRYPLEVNSVVLEGRLQFCWTFSRSLQGDRPVDGLADAVLSALQELIAHCVSKDSMAHTPSDFPLAHLDQPALDRLVSGRRVEDIYPLAPMQALHFSADPRAVLSVFDQWQCSLLGNLNVPALQQAWHETVQRHTILRSSFHGEDVQEPVQVVHRSVELPWTVEDWRGQPSAAQASRWPAFLAADRSRPLRLTDAPVMRFALVQVADDRWKFVWSVPAILLDGWSWPRVFSDVGRFYAQLSHGRSLVLDPVRPYRDYIGWLRAQSLAGAELFWRQQLEGFTEPTPLVSDNPDRQGEGDRYGQRAIAIAEDVTRALDAAAREQHVTLNTLVQAAWALVLSRQSSREDVVFGAAFSGRPADLRGAESIVGPFVNNLPVRMSVSPRASSAEFLRDLQARILDLSTFQYTPLVDIQKASGVPVRYRLFESLVVFQNYSVDESARRLGPDIEIADFIGPIHSAYPILLLAEPGSSLNVTMIYDRKKVAGPAVECWLRDVATLLEHLPGCLDRPLGDLQALMTTPAGTISRVKTRLAARSQNYVPPQSDLERQIAGVWRTMFGDEVSIDDNFFDLGGHSLLLVQMHRALRETLRTEFPVVTLFAHPTIRSLAEELGRTSPADSTAMQAVVDRAEQQKRALQKLRKRRVT